MGMAPALRPSCFHVPSDALSGLGRTINTMNSASANAIDHVRNQALLAAEMVQLCRSLASYATRLCLVAITAVSTRNSP